MSRKFGVFSKMVFVTVAALLVGSYSANATIVYDGANVQISIANGIYADEQDPEIEMVYLDSNDAGEFVGVTFDGVTYADTVTGHVGGQTSSDILNFASTHDLVSKEGFANILPIDNQSSIHDLTIFSPDYYFSELYFSINLDNLTGKTTTDDPVISITVKFASGLTSEIYASYDDGILSGEFRYAVQAEGDALIESVTITSDYITSVGSELGISDFKQTRIGLETAPVPEPATLLLLGTGLAGLAGSRIRRKKLTN